MQGIALYLSVGFAYGLWAMVVLQFRTCGIFASCPDLPQYPSRILTLALAVLPDVLPYSMLIAIGRGLMWLPNLVLAIAGYKNLSFLDWLLVRDVPSMAVFYSNVGALLP